MKQLGFWMGSLLAIASVTTTAASRIAGDGSAGKAGLTARLSSVVVSRAASPGPGFLQPELCFAPGTPPEVVRRAMVQRSLATGLQQRGSFQFSDTSRWSTTATDGSGLTQGQVTTLTWNIVPDGTPVGGFNGEPAANSNLRAFLDGIYGNEATWIQHFQTVFNQWGALTGVNYVKVAYDDNSPLLNGGVSPFNPGIINVRADVRISGHFIDGDFGILAYNFFPNLGDMVIDTGDVYYSLPGGGLANGSLGFRNMLAHEHGHGLGFSHSCPISNSKLMEPFLSTAFDHAQLDDKLAGWRGYGDDKENNETSGTASNLGSLGNGTTTLNDLSLDDNSDVDFYKFTVPSGKKAAVTLTPIGATYLAGPQNGDGSCSAGTSFNALTLNDVGVELRGTDGTTILASANAFGAGVAESIPATTLGGAGTFFVRGFAGATNTVQGYQLQVTISDAALSMTINDVSVTEGNAGPTTATFTVSLSAPAPGAVSATFTTANGTATTADSDYVAATGNVSFAVGEQTKQIGITINGDTRNEANETFFVNLSGASGAVITDSQGQGTITNDDPLPSLSVNDVALVEGNAGTSTANFTVTLSAASGQTVTVTAQTADGTASAPSDYISAGPTVLTFAPGEISKSFPVTVNGDTAVESTETFSVNLSGATNATISDATGVGTITSDDLPARIFVSESGSDANDCSVQTTPCRNIGAAILQTATDGEVIVLTPGEYETATLAITKGIKITSPSGTVAFIRQPITVNAPGGRVVLRGLTIKGAGTGNGVTLTAADSLSIEDSTLDQWGTGVRLNNAGAARVSILNSAVRNNTSGILDGGAAAGNLVAVNESRFERNGKGLEILAGSFQVKDSAFVGNTGSGIVAGPGSVNIQRSEFALNGTGVSALSGGTVRIGRSRVFGNTVGFSAAGGSAFESFATNVVRGNVTNITGTITTISEQ